MISRQDLLSTLNSLLTPEQFDDYAPNGLQIEGKESVKKLAFAVSATQDSIREAIQWGADALIVHHGVFWKYQGARPLTGAWGERLKLCVKNDLNLIAYHLPLDAHSEVGNAVALAEALGLKNLRPFGAYKRQFLGVQGELSTPLSTKECELQWEKILGHKIMTAVMDESKQIRHIGIITGGANNDWVQALDAGLDGYLTGEISEYNWHDAREAGIAYFAAGHHATEKFGPEALMRKLKSLYPSVDVQFFDSPNPA